MRKQEKEMLVHEGLSLRWMKWKLTIVINNWYCDRPNCVGHSVFV